MTKSHHYMPFVVSLSLQKALNSRWRIGTGLRYTRLKTDITIIGSYETETKTKTQKVEYIGIPLNVNYNLWRTGNLSLYTSAGIVADIPVSGSKTWQWSLSAGAGLQYQLAPSISIFAEPSLNYRICRDGAFFDRDQQEIHLTPMQRELLTMFFDAPDHKLLQTDITHHLWPKKDDASEKTKFKQT